MTKKSTKEMANDLDIDEDDLKKVLISLGMQVLQSEAEAIQAVDLSERDQYEQEEHFQLQTPPEIKHYRDALKELMPRE